MATSRLLACALLISILGCSRGIPPEIETPPNADGTPAPLQRPEVDFSAPTEAVDLAALLLLPREELAQRCEEQEKNIRIKEQFRLEGKLKFSLLPNAKLPLVTPIFRDAAYAKDRGLSLPPYLKVDAHDSAVAFHVGRHGDLEAAEKLIEPGDDDTLKLLRESASEKAYPVEWSRLVALLLHLQEIALATDNKDGAKNLLDLHRQLRTVLDDKAKSGPLGAALLGRGLGTLKQAAAAWKGINRDDLETQITSAIAALGPLPVYTIAVPRSIDSLANVFGTKAGPNAVIAFSPDRVADLLNIYIPTNESDTCVAFADDARRPAEILFTYRPMLFDFDTPQQFAEPIEDLLPGRKDDTITGCPRRVWDLGTGQLELTLTPRHATLGGVVRIQLPATARTAELPRDFGPVHLDRTYEANRKLAAWAKRGATLTFTDTAAAIFGNPLKNRPVADVVIEREPKHDLVSRITFHFAESLKDNAPAAGNVARPLFWSAGRPAIIFGEVGSGNIDFVWNDATTRYRLMFPYSRDKMISLEVNDASGTDNDFRGKTAIAKDAADRLERIKSRKPLAVVPRQIDAFKLGMSRAEFKKALPKSPQLVERDIPGGMMAALLGAPPPGDAVAREWFARFENDALVDLHVRYVDMPTNKPGTFLKKLEALKAKLGPAETVVIAGGTWADLPKRGNTATFTWHDDTTRLSCLQEPHGMELILRDCPAEHPLGVTMPPIDYLSRGAAAVKLGMTADELSKLGAQPSEGNAYMLDGATTDGFDVILAWLEGGKVTRIVARHKAAAALKAEDQAARMILENWARDSRTLGWPHRQDMIEQKLQSLASRDDHTRYRIYWQNDPQGLHVFSEWKEVK